MAFELNRPVVHLQPLAGWNGALRTHAPDDVFADEIWSNIVYHPGLMAEAGSVHSGPTRSAR